MSSLTINGIVIYQSAPEVQPKPPIRSLGSLVIKDGVVISDTRPATCSTTFPRVLPKAPIGFQPVAPSVPYVPKPKAPSVLLGSRKEYLRAIELAAAKVLTDGTNLVALGMIHRGRLGGRKDNMGELMGLLQRYQS